MIIEPLSISAFTKPVLYEVDVYLKQFESSIDLCIVPCFFDALVWFWPKKICGNIKAPFCFFAVENHKLGHCLLIILRYNKYLFFKNAKKCTQTKVKQNIIKNWNFASSFFQVVLVWELDVIPLRCCKNPCFYCKFKNFC